MTLAQFWGAPQDGEEEALAPTPPRHRTAPAGR